MSLPASPSRVPVRTLVILGVLVGGATIAALQLSSPAPVAPSAPMAIARDDASPAPGRPTFDVVRVTPEGLAVMAGRAEPGARVTIKDAERTIGQTWADSSGAWALVPSAPLPQGARELSVMAQGAEGPLVSGDSPVLLIVPASNAAPPSPTQPAPGRNLLARPAAPGAPTAVATRAPATIGNPTPEPAATEASAPPPAPLAVLASAGAPSRLLQASGMAGAGHLALDTLDYDDQGAIRFSGTAPPRAPIRVYVDSARVGDASATESGHWSLSPDQPVAPGVHRLRVDQLAADGHVAGRLELPFLRETLALADVKPGEVIVQPGQNLWRLARRVYGNGIRYIVIYHANREQIRDPRLIYPGQVFATPAAARTP